ncbi:hypothetical protein HDU77_004735 [Chytriomyces hyalinus]|nr:hypothetical protein HDU77_004735 [Chytriomyces hyalinus]
MAMHMSKLNANMRKVKLLVMARRGKEPLPKGPPPPPSNMANSATTAPSNPPKTKMPPRRSQPLPKLPFEQDSDSEAAYNRATTLPHPRLLSALRRASLYSNDGDHFNASFESHALEFSSDISDIAFNQAHSLPNNINSNSLSNHTYSNHHHHHHHAAPVVPHKPRNPSSYSSGLSDFSNSINILDISPAALSIPRNSPPPPSLSIRAATLNPSFYSPSSMSSLKKAARLDSLMNEIESFNEDADDSFKSSRNSSTSMSRVHNNIPTTTTTTKTTTHKKEHRKNPRERAYETAFGTTASLTAIRRASLATSNTSPEPHLTPTSETPTTTTTTEPWRAYPHRRTPQPPSQVPTNKDLAYISEILEMQRLQQHRSNTSTSSYRHNRNLLKYGTNSGATRSPPLDPQEPHNASLYSPVAASGSFAEDRSSSRGSNRSSRSYLEPSSPPQPSRRHLYKSVSPVDRGWNRDALPRGVDEGPVVLLEEQLMRLERVYVEKGWMYVAR